MNDLLTEYAAALAGLGAASAHTALVRAHDLMATGVQVEAFRETAELAYLAGRTEAELSKAIEAIHAGNILAAEISCGTVLECADAMVRHSEEGNSAQSQAVAG